MQIRVLQALSTGRIGGAETMVLKLVSHLDTSRFVSEVSFLDGRGRLSQSFEAAGIPTHDLSVAGGYLGAFWRFVQLVRARRFHIVHLYGFRVSLLGRLAARAVRPRPAVVHGIRGFHVSESEDVRGLRTKMALMLERLGAPLVDAYIPNSCGAEAFLCAWGLPKVKFITIPNGIEPLVRKEVGAREPLESPTIICVANLRPRKRQADLVEAVARLRERGVSVRCVLVGDGPTREAVEALVRARKLGGVVECLGSRPSQEVHRLLQSADVFVLPSLWEGMPVSVMEAMATGLPVVGTDVPGIRELVVDGDTGFLAPGRDPAALAERIERLARDASLRFRMGEAGRRRVMTEFALDTMVRRYEEAYLRLAREVALDVAATRVGPEGRRDTAF